MGFGIQQVIGIGIDVLNDCCWIEIIVLGFVVVKEVDQECECDQEQEGQKKCGVV